MADTNSKTPNAEASTTDKIIEQAEDLLGQAKDAITDAFEATVDAVKEHPVTTAAIVGGAAAAVAGAVYGAGKLLTPNTDPKPAKK